MMSRLWILTLAVVLLPAQEPAQGNFNLGKERGGSTHEPLSVPGGHIFVPATLIPAAGSEAEFAGMLAHAMAHVTERHGIRTSARGQGNRSPLPARAPTNWMPIG
jgi:hypothetical protein